MQSFRVQSALFGLGLMWLCTAATHADEKLKGIACRSVHLAYTGPEATTFYNEVKVERSADGTYFCVCGFSKGYYGIQELANGKKLLIFSVWDPGAQQNPKDVPEERRVKLLYQDPKVRVGRFGNEGTGGQSFFDYDWQIGQTYAFAVTAKHDGPERTAYTAFFRETNTWRKLVTFSTLTKGELLKGYYSFVEDFRRNKISTTKNRQAEFSNAWIQTKKGWQPLDEARFTADSNPVLNINAGMRDNQFFLSTGGDIKNADTPLRDKMKRKAGAAPQFDVAAEAPPPMNLGRGINLGNALEAPKEGEWGVKLKAEYFSAIKKAGFATVRLPVRWSAHAGKTAPYTIDATFAERVDWAIDQALKNELNIIVNVHHYGEMDENPDEHLPCLDGMWQQIAARYKDRPARVYFELLNEPHGKLTEAKWNAAFPKLLATVRKSNPTRPIIVGPGQWNSIRALDKLELPKDDRNLIVTVHFYDPFEFTHQGAHWVKGADKWKGRTWVGNYAEKGAMTQQLEKAAAWGKKHDRPIFLGEFGAFEPAEMQSRVRWTNFVTREAERLGFGWAYWEFCSGFGAYDPKTDMWREPLRKALIP